MVVGVFCSWFIPLLLISGGSGILPFVYLSAIACIPTWTAFGLGKRNLELRFRVPVQGCCTSLKWMQWVPGGDFRMCVASVLVKNTIYRELEDVRLRTAGEVLRCWHSSNRSSLADGVNILVQQRRWILASPKYRALFQCIGWSTTLGDCI